MPPDENHGTPSLIMAPPVPMEPAGPTSENLPENRDPSLEAIGAPVPVTPEEYRAMMEEIARVNILGEEYHHSMANFKMAMERIRGLDTAIADQIARLDELENLIRGKVAQVFNRHFGGLK